MLPGRGIRDLVCPCLSCCRQLLSDAIKLVHPNRLPLNDPVLEVMGSASIGSGLMAEYEAMLSRVRNVQRGLLRAHALKPNGAANNTSRKRVWDPLLRRKSEVS